MRPRTAVVTIAHGRHEHLAGQLWGLARQSLQPDVFVAVAMDDPAVRDVVEQHALPAWSVHVPYVAATPSGLPLAAARNAGARAATEAGADRLVFLDVDCIPSAGLVARYAAVLGSRSPASTGGGGRSEGGPVVACGEVGYLAPVRDPSDYRSQDVERLARPHPARPSLTIEEVRHARDVTLFWSLSFALTTGRRGHHALGRWCDGIPPAPPIGEPTCSASRGNRGQCQPFSLQVGMVPDGRVAVGLRPARARRAGIRRRPVAGRAGRGGCPSGSPAAAASRCPQLTSFSPGASLPLACR